MTNAYINLETLISKETLKKSLFGVVLAFVILFFIAIFFVVHQNNESHKQNINHLVEKLNNSLSNFQQQIENLANNDLIINSLVDYTNRDNYLPIFFRSFKLNNSVNNSIVFTDYTGEVITGNNVDLHQKIVNQFNWQESVLENGLPYFEYSEFGLFAAAPVLLSEFPEGAIIAYITNLQELIPDSNSNSTLLFINDNNKVLYSSNNQLIPYDSLFIETKFLFWSKNKHSYLSGQIVSIEPPLSAYGNILWLAIFIAVSLIFIFLGLMSNVKSTAKYASNSMQELQTTLAEAIGTKGKNIEITNSDDEPIEFVAIRKEFNTVLNHLFNQTISVQKFTSVINSLDEILFVLDEQKCIMLKNESFDIFCKDIGITLPKDIKKIIPDKEPQRKEVTETNFEVEYQPNYHGNSETSIIVQWSSSNYIDDKGEILGVIFVGKNITLAKKLEVDLLIKNHAIDGAETSIIISDAQLDDFPIIYANKSFCKLSGYSLNYVLGKNCRFLQGEKTNLSDIAKIKKAITNKQPMTITLTNYKKDGREFQNELTINPIKNEHGVVTHFLGIQLDVTEREITANYLKLAKQRAEESTQLKSEFLASMSHEIRTPMNGVIGMLDLLLMSKLNHEQQHNAEIAKDSAQSLLTIINDILDFSKIESGKLEIENSAFNIVSLFSHVAKAQAQHAHNKGIELVIDTSEIDIPTVTGDSGRIRQVLNNLLSNAIKFTEVGNVTITARLIRQSNQLAKLYCRVSDTGIGIDENRIEQVFDSFTQADSSTTRIYGGTGLGLAITSKLCELMKGSVNVTSEKEVGSCFNFNIELGIDENIENLTFFKLNRMKILLLDSDIKSAEVLKKQLEKWGGDIVINTEQNNCIPQIESGGFRIVFIDSSYANGSAIELTKSLALKYKTEISFILMTKVNENYDRSFIIDAGFRHFFSKPATPDTLTLALEDVLSNKTIETIDIPDNRLTKSVKRKSSISILLVEDNRTNQLVAKKLLSELGGEVTIANNGQEAIDILNNTESSFKIIFMDCQMPIIDGYQATEKIRAGAAGKKNETMPIIAMTANAMKGDREKCLLYGMDDYISKPINIDTLRKKIDLWLH